MTDTPSRPAPQQACPEKPRRTMQCTIGPCAIPIYPVTAFTRIPNLDRYDAWRLVGPTVHRNINAPLWQQFMAVYLEGLNHGSAMERERINGNL
jgi:hypothetical protein